MAEVSDELATAFLADERRRAEERLHPLGPDDLHELYHRLVDLPKLDRSLVVEVPASTAAEIARAGHGDEVDRMVDPLLATLRAPARRAGLARSVLDLAAAKRVERDLAAVAVLDLTEPDSVLVRSSLAVAVNATVAVLLAAG